MFVRLVAFISVIAFAAVTCAAEDTCFDCHGVQEGTSLRFKDDIHRKKTLSCDDCHGGDPTVKDMNASKQPQTGFRPRPSRQSMPDFCGRCHSDAKYMARFDPKESVSSLALYARGVHGMALAKGNKKSAQCVDCHSVHDIQAVADPDSPVSPKNIGDTCAKCHPADAAAFKESTHGRLFTTDKMPGCVTCHAGHDTQPASTALLVGDAALCLRCHKPDSDQVKAGQDMAQVLTSLEAAGPTSKEALARARAAVHTFDPEAVERAAAPPATSATQPETAPK
jgi:predicted CXXCH cytochrome family protein